MTDKTVIRTATPKVNPIIDIFEIIDMNDRLYLEKSNLYAKRIFINVYMNTIRGTSSEAIWHSQIKLTMNI